MDDSKPPEEDFRLTNTGTHRMLRELLAKNEEQVADVVPPAKHKRYAKRAMRRRKSSAHIGPISLTDIKTGSEKG